MEGRDHTKKPGRKTLPDFGEGQDTGDPQGVAEDRQGVGVTILPARIGTRDDCSLSQGEVRMG